MDERHDILTKAGRHDGMTVPEGYFESFASDMMSRLPEQPRHTEPEVVPLSMWQRVRPYVYLAAMFCGIWLMLWMFNHISHNSGSSMIDNPVLARAFESEHFYDNYISDDIDQYDLLEDMYNDGVTLASFTAL